ncbi:hypothetical protein RHMOL_Rhmol01G0149800 [Rhododendron molle]|uniref:Uncharacterized protein n=1 Tax=Rhododendron molle TaxID=49168 RepID=A0ACC0Q4B5_RHOML|nr:hypothetical protein RHMOL_Rhmol01G0149800 [Rhododendron molle]
MSSPTISHVVSFNQSTMISHVIADDQPFFSFNQSTTICHIVRLSHSAMISHVIVDDQPCRHFQSIHDDQPFHRRRSAMSSLKNQSTMISHIIADDQPCRLFQSIDDDQPCLRRRSAMFSLSINQRRSTTSSVSVIHR